VCLSKMSKPINKNYNYRPKSAPGEQEVKSIRRRPRKKKNKPRKNMTPKSYHLHRQLQLSHSYCPRVEELREEGKFVLVDKKNLQAGILRDETFRPKKIENNSEASVSGADFMDPRIKYRFLLKGISTIVANGTGVVAAFLPMDPTSTGYNFAEWTDLAALFSEYRLVKYSVQFVGIYNTTAAMNYFPIGIGSNIATSSAPTSLGEVLQQADGRLWKATQQTTDLGMLFHVRPGVPLGWASIASPTNTPYAGAPGCVQIYSASQGVGANIALAMVCGLYEFRVRS